MADELSIDLPPALPGQPAVGPSGKPTKTSGLASRMPSVYSCPSRDPGEGLTRYLLLDGPGSASVRANLVTGKNLVAGRSRGVRIADFEDGLSKTILVVESPADRAVTWTKPEELTVSRPGLGRIVSEEGNSPAAPHQGGLRNVVFCDGHVATMAINEF